MTYRLTRRRFVEAMTASAGGLAAAGLASGLPGMRRALAARNLVVVTWGGPWIDSVKPFAKAFSEAHDVRFAWELHQGGSQNILAKIRATWPVVKYDLVSAWNPTFSGMITEDWLETVTVDDIPNLKDVPDHYIMKDAQGNGKIVPATTGSTFWGYRTDLVKKPITSFEDMLDPSLKGKVAIWDPTAWSSLPYISMALEYGGSEKNMDPGFEFLKRLAQTGNISRILNSDVDQTTTMTTGESAVSFGFSAAWTEASKSQPIKVLSRVPGSGGLKGFLYNEGWGILKGPNADLAKEFANFTISPENNEVHNEINSSLPTNTKAKPSAAAAPYVYAPEEFDKFAYIPDYGYVIEHVDGWAKRFETEVVPLIRQA